MSRPVHKKEKCHHHPLFFLENFGQKSPNHNNGKERNKDFVYILNLLGPCVYHALHLAPVGTKLPALDDSKICRNLINL